jgi:hypothetical protein
MLLAVILLAGCAPIPKPDTTQLPPVWPSAPASARPAPVEHAPAPAASPEPEPSKKTPVPPLKQEVIPPSTPPRT